MIPHASVKTYLPTFVIAVAASDGAKAAIEAERWLRLTYGNTGMSDGGHPPALVAEDVPARDEGERAARYDQVDGWSEDKDDKNPENCDLTTATCIGTVVSRHPVTVFSKPWCPYCVAGRGAHAPHRRVRTRSHLPLLRAGYGIVGDDGGPSIAFIVV